MYQIQATITRTRRGSNRFTKNPPTYTETVQCMTFYLDENVQGIVSKEHAEKIAIDILNPFGDNNITVSVAVEYEPNHFMELRW